jgi:hypothetical protein
LYVDSVKGISTEQYSFKNISWEDFHI